MSKYDLFLDLPLMNAAGTLGFVPNPHGPADLSRLGAFVTNPISLGPRAPTGGIRYLSYPGGFMLHTGYPNPGLKVAIRRYATRWEGSPLPVLVHLLAQDPGEAARMIARLEELPGIMGFEIGLPPGCDALSAVEFARASLGELPIVLRLPFERASELAPALVDTGLAAVSLAPPRGALTGPTGRLVYGRLFGPAIFPHALKELSLLVDSGLAVMGSGGVYRREQVEVMLNVGVVAVQLDAVLWRGDW